MGLLDGTGAYGSGMTPQQMGLQDNWGLSGQTTPFPMQPYIVKPQSGVPGPPGVPGANGGQQQGGGFMSGLPQGTGTNGQTNGFSNMLQQFMGGSGGAPSGADGMGSMGMTPADIGAASAGSGAAGGAAGGAAADGGGAGLASLLASVVCTEGMRQGKIPKAHWVHGSRAFIGYSDEAKRTYYKFAIPAVRHMRRKPDSLLTKALVAIFGAHSEHIAALAGCPGARRRIVGRITSTILPPLGTVLGSLVFRKAQDHTALYREAK